MSNDVYVALRDLEHTQKAQSYFTRLSSYTWLFEKPEQTDLLSRVYLPVWVVHDLRHRQYLGRLWAGTASIHLLPCKFLFQQTKESFVGLPYTHQPIVCGLCETRNHLAPLLVTK